MGQSSEKRTDVLQAMNSIRDLIGSTTQSIQQLTSMNVQVATAATEQSSVANDIAQNVSTIAQLAEDIGDSSNASRHQFEELEQLSSELNLVT